MEQNKIALILAIYGAILSTIAILWNIRRDLKDRAEIRVHVKLVSRQGPTISFVEYICVELSNTGKRPVTIIEIRYQIEKQIYLAKPSQLHSLPKELGEGQFFGVDIMKDKIENPDMVESFIVKDARGIEYSSKKYPLKKH